jgi:uncharacterized protein YkwD
MKYVSIFQELIMQMLGFNLIDVLIILALASYVLLHMREGFAELSRRLLSFIGALLGAFLLYGRVSTFLDGFVAWPSGIVDAVSFMIAFVMVQFLLGIFFGFLFSLFPIDSYSPRLSRLLAIVPAFVDGLILVSLTLLLLVIMPFFPGLKSPIENSYLGSMLVNRVAQVEIYVDQVFGEATQETLGFLTIKPGEEDTIILPFKAEKLSIDEKSEQRMLELINEERMKAGVKPLVLDKSIVPVARVHSRDMWERSYFAHEDPDGKTPFDRMKEGGIDFRSAGENLALARTVERAHIGLMNSPGHKRNILDPAFGRVGIGVIDGGIYGKMFTQNFAD